MFKITIEGETMSALAASILALAGLFQTTAVEAEAKPARKKAEPKETSDKEPEGNAEAAPAETTPAEPAARTKSTPAVPSDGPIEWDGDVPGLRNKCMELADKCGAGVLQAALAEAGSPTGWKGVPADNYPALNARVTDLLAAAQKDA